MHNKAAGVFGAAIALTLSMQFVQSVSAVVVPQNDEASNSLAVSDLAINDALQMAESTQISTEKLSSYLISNHATLITSMTRTPMPEKQGELINLIGKALSGTGNLLAESHPEQKQGIYCSIMLHHKDPSTSDYLDFNCKVANTKEEEVYEFDIGEEKLTTCVVQTRNYLSSDNQLVLQIRSCLSKDKYNEIASQKSTYAYAYYEPISSKEDSNKNSYGLYIVHPMKNSDGKDKFYFQVDNDGKTIKPHPELKSALQSYILK